MQVRREAKAGSDAVLDSIDGLLATLDLMCEHRTKIGRRAALIRRRRELGEPYSVIVPTEDRPLIVERARQSLTELVAAAGRLQRAEAHTLYAEGMSMKRIALLFGITRQRVGDFVRRELEHVTATIDATLAEASPTG